MLVQISFPYFKGVKVVGVVSSDGGGGSEAGVLDWGMLVEVICTCSDTMLSKYCTQWTQQLTSVLQVKKEGRDTGGGSSYGC